MDDDGVSEGMTNTVTMPYSRPDVREIPQESIDYSATDAYNDVTQTDAKELFELGIRLINQHGRVMQEDDQLVQEFSYVDNDYVRVTYFSVFADGLRYFPRNEEDMEVLVQYVLHPDNKGLSGELGLV